MARSFARASSQYLENTSSPVADVGAALTIVAWYKPSSIANGTVIGLGTAAGTDASYHALGMNGSGVAFLETSGDDSTGGTLTSGTWHHLAAVITSSSSRLVYLDGVAGTASTTAQTSSDLDTVTVGGLMLNGSLVSFAGGEIGECAIWNVALTGTDISNLAAGALPSSIPSGLVDYWPITGTASPEVDGASGARNLTVVGATNAGEDPPVTGGGTVAAPVAAGTGDMLAPGHRSGSTSIRVRELPPLRLHVQATAPTGRTYRWGPDEPNPANVPSGLSFSSTMPGGFEQADMTLARKPGVAYSDLDRLSTLRVIGAGGDIAGEYRLERAPRVSGDQMAISPSAMGWQAALADDESAVMIYRDIDLSQWAGPGVQRQINLQANFAPTDPRVEPDATTGAPSVATGVTGPWSTTPGRAISEAWFDGGSGCRIGELAYAWKRGPNLNNADTNWTWLAGLGSDDILTASDLTANLRAAGPGSGTVTATGDRRFAVVQLAYANVASASNDQFDLFWTLLAVYGDHGLTVQGTEPDAGLLASDVIAHAVARWAPILTFTTGETIIPSSFVIPQLTFKDQTTASAIIQEATKYDLQDWAVWENRTFYWAPRGTFGRKWRARIAPAQLQETGPQIDRLWESVVVQYQDVDGSTRTVGPPGSGADTEDASLKDTDPENPANELGITRRTMLTMGTSVAAAAVKVGATFLAEQKLLDSSGQAQLVGHVEDEHGVIHPA